MYINHMQAAERAKNAIFCPWWPWLLTLTFKLVQVRDQTPNTSYVWICHKSVQCFQKCHTQTKKQTDGAKNRPFCSLLRMAKIKRPVSSPGSRDLICGPSSPGSRDRRHRVYRSIRSRQPGLDLGAFWSRQLQLSINLPVSLSPVILFHQPLSSQSIVTCMPQ